MIELDLFSPEEMLWIWGLVICILLIGFIWLMFNFDAVFNVLDWFGLDNLIGG